MGMTLVTGASGFVGSHLMEEMTQRGLPVRGVTRGTVSGLVTVPSYGPEMDWNNHLSDVSTVVHLAARAHILREVASDPLREFREANVVAMQNLAKQASSAGVRRFILISSIGVNGNVTQPGQRFTSADVPSPHSDYATAKAEAEASLKEICRNKALEFVIIRPPLMYGPGVQANFLKLMKLAAQGIPSPFAAVSNRKSFLYVKNLCDLIITTLDHPEAANQVFLVSDGYDVSTGTLYRDLMLAFGKKPYQLPVPAGLLKSVASIIGVGRTVEQLIGNLQIDDSDMRTQLNWRQPYTYSEGIAATARAFTSKP
jgi:nucleoside-diphosphate-sugar epimerase